VSAHGHTYFPNSSPPQAYSPALPVGAQHYYKSAWDALTTIFRAQGFRGLTNGIDAAVLRTAMGSSVQLPSYNWTKNQLVQNGITGSDSIWTFLASSAVSGACVVGQSSSFE
jgi:solute carrier family 25 protein 34/35